MKNRTFAALALVVLGSGASLNLQAEAQSQDKPIVVGSKLFIESGILGEVVVQALNEADIKAIHKANFGGTRILWNALLSGDIDLYPEYTGTLKHEILRQPVRDLEHLRGLLKPFGLGAAAPLGFNNTYAIGVTQATAKKYDLRTISDLGRVPGLKYGFTNEFMDRQDGWPGLRAKYDLKPAQARGLDHDIAYRALESGDIDVMDLYSTDAEIKYYDLVLLEDDRLYFPRYDALYIYRLDTVSANELALEVVNSLSGKIKADAMVDLNARVKLKKKPASEVAAVFLNTKMGFEIRSGRSSRFQRIQKRTLEHFRLVGLSLALAVLVAIPLGVMASEVRCTGNAVLWSVGMVQTIPSLALLVILIRPLNWLGLPGIGDPPALVALFLYSLLPIVRSTYVGFQSLSQTLRETGQVLGLSRWTRLFKIDFQMALPSILSGIKTAAVLNVGFATLGALIGAGGYGQPILTGIRLDDYGLILEGAIPSAVMAILVQQMFDVIERLVVSKGLRA